MSLLSEVTLKAEIRPPRLVIYGKSKVGKTTFAAGIPGVVLLPAEEGEGILDVPRLPRPESYEDVLRTIAALIDEEHDYKALCIDTIDSVELLLWQAVCRDQSTDKRTYTSVEDFGYGKGYVYADPYWTRLLKGLDLLRAKRRMVTVLIAHADTKTVNDPVHGAYDVIQTNLHKRANALLHAWADVIGYAEIERHVVTKGDKSKGQRETDVARTTGRRILNLEDAGGFIGGNRYGLPPKIDLSWPALRAEIGKSIAAKKTTEPATDTATGPNGSAPTEETTHAQA